MAFQPFDRHQPVEQNRRNLPHWQQSGATYFVTFRLADSLPSEVRDRLSELQRLNDTDAFAWIDRYLDAGTGSLLLAESAHASLVESALRHFDGNRYALGAFVIMPNHVHVLLQPTAAHSLTSIIHSLKSYTARQLQRAAGIRGQVWRDERFDRIVRDVTELRGFHEYIFANPFGAHLEPGTFICGQGSAGWFADQPA